MPTLRALADYRHFSIGPGTEPFGKVGSYEIVRSCGENILEVINRAIVLAKRPERGANGAPLFDGSIFKLTERPLKAPAGGEVLLRNLYLSLDPYMAAYSLLKLDSGQTMEARVVSQVAASNNPHFAKGDLLWGFLGWEEYSVLTAELTDRRGYDLRLNRIDSAIWPPDCPLSYAISILGMPGLTAYVGVVEVGKASPGETVFISSAAGALGQVAGQVAKRIGCRVVGSAGSEEKLAFLQELGFDAAFNYKTAQGRLDVELGRVCPEGIDVYFDNVGGEMLDAVIVNANRNARIALCGMISTYNEAEPYRPRNLFQMIGKSVTMQGFSIYDHYPQDLPAYQAKMGAWLKEGKVTYREVIIEGLDNTVTGFLDMLAGRHGIGKCLIALPH